MHVEVYKVWACNCDGDYAIAFEIREDAITIDKLKVPP
jgi:hypothetical protein